MLIAEWIATASVVVSGLAVLAALWNNRKIREVHFLVNSRMTELVEAVRMASSLAGIEAGRKEERANPDRSVADKSGQS